MSESYTALIYGSTGAVGRQLVDHLLKSLKWKKIIVVVRNPLKEWQSHPQKQKLEIQVLSNMDDLLTPQKFQYQNVDALFCALGSQIKYGQQTFVKVDKTYPLCAADIAIRNKIPHYLLVSSMSASTKSCLLYSRTKGEVQEELKGKKLSLLTIFRPGLIANRNNARFGQKIINFFCGCCIPKIQSPDCAKVLMITAERDIKKSKTNNQNSVQMYENNGMLQILDQGFISNIETIRQQSLLKRD